MHQGVVLEAELLPAVALDEVTPRVSSRARPGHRPAKCRRCVALRRRLRRPGVVMPERHSPPSRCVAKSASGALDLVPVILVGNLAQSLAELGGLASSVSGWPRKAPSARDRGADASARAVLGAEGKGCAS